MTCDVCGMGGGVVELSSGFRLHPSCFENVRDFHTDAVFAKGGRVASLRGKR